MLKKTAIILIAFGLFFILYAGYSFYDYSKGSQKQLILAENYVNSYKELRDSSSITKEKVEIFKADMAPKIGEIFATIEIPIIDLNLPIVEGVGMEQLKYGVGHEPTTWLPEEKNQVFLAGHNNTAFKQMGDIKKGDRIILHLPYGSFEYEMVFSDIGHEAEVDRVRSLDHEQLVLMTCYPFYSFSDTDERYFIYANPVE
ncbi:class D sortase [Ornithinibacillus halotolerans]|uniref:Class D sortase n=1 Tax=Ornithinibacillus halotolerans TaxID=1274357 RepID=A0A916RTN3_9BACI|nr:class D sortase [Ornithinibacillus halotolerans]GGA70614.1 hypothetical protein GCM10008025_13060 [Ornithinibacillus halotolerans]